MLQEYIPGGDDSIWMFNGYFDEESECLFGMTGRKIRQSPVHTGVTSLGVCLRNSVVDRLTKGFMKNIGYKGILDIGYRYDVRDGKYKVLDVNPRIGSTFRLFVGNNGLDVVRAEYLDLSGQSVPSSEIVEGRKWFVEDRDLVSSVRYRYEKSLTFRQWLTSFRGVQESAWFAWDDLSPFFMMCARSSRKVLSKTDNGALNPYRLTP
jgi:predicted ATP-grasp superfamily ATP-dependent carboligase